MNDCILKDYERWLKTKVLSKGSIETYRRTAQRIGGYLSKQYRIEFTFSGVAAIRGYMVSTWATEIMEADYKVSTKTCYLTAANIFLDYLYDMQLVEFRLSDALPSAKNLRKIGQIQEEPLSSKKGYTEEELQKMLANSGQKTFNRIRNRALICVLLGTGLRASELACLKVGDITPETKFVRVPRKGSHGIPLSVPIAKEAVDQTMIYLELRREKRYPTNNTDALFISNRGNPMDRFAIYQALSAIEKAAGASTGVHTFRHTTLSAIAEGANAVVARDVAGHRSVAVTNRYLHTSPEKQYKATELLRPLILPMDDQEGS